MRTFFCSWPGLPDAHGSPVVAATRSKARYLYWLRLSDAWPMAKLTEIIVRCAPTVKEEERTSPATDLETL